MLKLGGTGVFGFSIVQLWAAPKGDRRTHLFGAHILFLGRIRGTLKREPLLNPLLALLSRDLIQRVYIPKIPLILSPTKP